MTPRRLQQLVTEKVIPKPGTRGNYEPVSTTLKYIRFLRNRSMLRDGDSMTRTEYSKLKEEKMKQEQEMLKVKIQREQIELEKTLGNLIEAQVAIAIINRAVSKLSNDVDQMPRLLAHATNPEDPKFSEAGIRDYVEKVIKPNMQKAIITSIEEEEKELQSEDNAKRQGRGERTKGAVKKKPKTAKKTAKKRAKPSK